MTDTTLKLFQDTNIRTQWDADAEKWYFSIVDVIAALTESDYQHSRNYWKVLKSRLKAEGNETVTNCNQLKLVAPDGKLRMTDVADTEQLLRLIQSVPSKKAEPFKLWLASVGSERIDEISDPEIAIQRALNYYQRLGYSDEWIAQRLRSIEIRKDLTNQWDKGGIKKGLEYALLTDEITRSWSGMKTKEYKQHKGLKKESLRDNMTNAELVLNMLAELSATEIAKNENPMGLAQNMAVAKRGGNVARQARLQLEQETGKRVVSGTNSKLLKRVAKE
ncbi:MAG: Bro-N domain-containing protein [Alphaproteobacteria bacterium]|nr:Bro-N domain-containing protein [Alphaproteobacteria bacterium]